MARTLHTLALFTKYWRPGWVKTRLAQHTGDQVAAQVCRLLLDHLLIELQNCPGQRVLMLAPDQCVALAEAELSKAPWGDACSAWPIRPQGQGDLGQRMMRFFQQSLTQRGAAIIVGGDCPTLDAELVAGAFEQLEHNDAVIGPSLDGGYYLLGLSGPWQEEYAALFQSMPWGTSSVYRNTVQTFNQHRWTWHALPAASDIDTWDDLCRLNTSLPWNNDPSGLRDALRQIVDSQSNR